METDEAQEDERHPRRRITSFAGEAAPGKKAGIKDGLHEVGRGGDGVRGAHLGGGEVFSHRFEPILAARAGACRGRGRAC
ncbi:MAG: hypothetical protein U0599_03840 [Vicinamibacteria bacterium]